MRFADKRYYVEAYIKCATCGVLIYDDGVPDAAAERIYCAEWCRQWAARRAAGMAEPRLALPRGDR